jgi:hypothetical protein
MEPNEFKACSIRSLPTEQLISAARNAIKVNPSNAPSMYQLMKAFPDLEPKKASLVVLTGKRWPVTGAHLTVGFLDNPPADLRKRILAHMNAWSEFCNVSFVEASDPTVRISRITEGDDSGYWSYLGTDVQLITDTNAPTMNLDSFTMATSESEFIRVVRHETGHTLGFPHEHLRAEIVNEIDEQEAIRFFHDHYGWPPEQVISNVLTPLNQDEIIGTPTADQDSIMCYWLPGQIMKNHTDVRGGTDIDAGDRAFAASVYPLS